MTSDESTSGPSDQNDQHDPDGDPEMLTSNAAQPDQAEGEDDPSETGDNNSSDTGPTGS